ncbi:Puromycin-sensitive aminopeptidase [Trichinella spiralis]|uniref:Aminopeptidase n=1 Tax=Trichinella spiralis TaxID=6334 RepID=A0A0V1AYV5_TRISP|nr:Puromycin-sensitive aminopeptidase [Trichinella spiralis]
MTAYERLPPSVKPKHYDLWLKIFETNFTAKVSIDIEIFSNVNSITLNSSELVITDATLVLQKKTYEKLDVSYDEHFGTAKMALPETIAPQLGKLHLTYNGIIKDTLKGLYKCTVEDEKPFTLLVTQFESRYARCVLPCWDEPVYKATFTVALTVPEQLTAISNMPVEKVTENEPGWKMFEFQKSPVMSTYLLAFVIGKLEFVEKTVGNTVCRVYTVPGKSNQGLFALDVMISALKFYENIFQVPYSLPKLDLVGIPNFEAGAMENWGLVTYRESCLLLKSGVTSARVRQNIALTVAHEIAHMWFGNLVTIEWWTFLFLTEGFATLMENICVDHIFPEFGIWGQFVTDHISYAMAMDALRSSHAIEVEISDPEEIDSIFDAVSYSKAACVIKMWKDYMGEEQFYKGLQLYLRKYSYQCATMENLIQMLESVSKGKCLMKMAFNWTQTTGFPMVEVSMEKVNGTRRLLFSQKRFLADGSEGKLLFLINMHENNSLWQIPISISDSGKAIHYYLLNERSGCFEMGEQTNDANQFIKINHNYSGFYRVKYSDEMLRMLLPAVEAKVLDEADRFSLCADSFAFVTAGYTTVYQYLNMLDSFKNETDYNVWMEIDRAVIFMDNCLQRTPLYGRFKAAMIPLYEQVFNRLGVVGSSGEAHTTKLLRPIIIRRMGEYGHQGVVKMAIQEVDNFLLDGVWRNADLRQMFFMLIAQFGGEPGFQKLRLIYESSSSSEIREQCLMAMGQSPELNLVKQVLELTLTDKVLLQDMYRVYFGVRRFAENNAVAWEFFKDNIQNIVHKCGYTSSCLFIYIIDSLFSRQCCMVKAKEMEDFCRGVNLITVGSELRFKQALECVEVNAKFLERNLPSVERWLMEKGF